MWRMRSEFHTGCSPESGERMNLLNHRQSGRYRFRQRSRIPLKNSGTV
jgi:hypothetical protein